MGYPNGLMILISAIKINRFFIYFCFSFIAVEISLLRYYYLHYVTFISHDCLTSKSTSNFVITNNLSNPSIVKKSYNEIPVENDRSKMSIEEPSYKQENHIFEYETSAMKYEVQKHDRLIVEGLAFIDNLNLGSEWEPNPIQKEKWKLCMNIYMCNRRIPYINTLLMSLINIDTPEELLSYAKINLLNIEKRSDKVDFSYMRNVLSQLPFISEVHNITYVDKIYESITLERSLTFREEFISDQISGLRICIRSNLDWCLMIEEDVILPVNFVKYLERDVIGPIEKDQTKDEISFISLYSYYNLVFLGNRTLVDPRYSKIQYENDRAISNSERKTKCKRPYKAKFFVRKKKYKYGTVAMLYTLDSARKLVKYLEKVGLDPIHNADEFINDSKYFPSFINKPRRQVEPSLVNHIGFYSERMKGTKTRGVFSQMNTDVRFTYDAGLY